MNVSLTPQPEPVCKVCNHFLASHFGPCTVRVRTSYPDPRWAPRDPLSCRCQRFRGVS